MSDLDARRDREQYHRMRTDAVIDLRRALRSVRDGASALVDRLERYDRLDEHDMDALAELIGTAVQAGRKAVVLDTLDSVNHLVPDDVDEDSA